VTNHNCEKFSFRGKYDKDSGSLLGRIWRWHISWCPGWKLYMKSLSDDKRALMADKYDLEKKD